MMNQLRRMRGPNPSCRGQFFLLVYPRVIDCDIVIPRPPSCPSNTSLNQCLLQELPDEASQDFLSFPTGGSSNASEYVMKAKGLVTHSLPARKTTHMSVEESSGSTSHGHVSLSAGMVGTLGSVHRNAFGRGGSGVERDNAFPRTSSLRRVQRVVPSSISALFKEQAGSGSGSARTTAGMCSTVESGERAGERGIRDPIEPQAMPRSGNSSKESGFAAHRPHTKKRRNLAWGEAAAVAAGGSRNAGSTTEGDNSTTGEAGRGETPRGFEIFIPQYGASKK